MNIEEFFRNNLKDAKAKTSRDLWKKMEGRLDSSAEFATSSSSWFSSLSSLGKTLIIGSASAAAIGGALLAYNALNTPESKETVAERTTENSPEKTVPEKTVMLAETKNRANADKAVKEAKPMEPEFTITEENPTDEAFMKSMAQANQPAQLASQTTTIIKQYARSQAKTGTTNPTIDTSSSPSQSTINIKIPNVITPNADGINDCFVIRNIESYSDNLLIIYDRKGRPIWQKKHYNNEFCGENLVTGAYFYTLQVRYDGKTKTFNGSLTIIR